MERGRRPSLRVLGATVVLVALACCVVAGLMVTRTATPSRPSEINAEQLARERTAVSVSTARAALSAGLKFTPTTGATAVAPAEPIVVKAGVGVLTDVRVTSGTGAVVAGDFSFSADEWRSRAPLAYGTDYRVVAKVAGPPHVQVESMATFKTVAPSSTVTATVWPTSGLQLGVGQPVSFRFNREITGTAERNALLKHLSVTAAHPVIGGWHWFSNTEVHYRPRKFWPAGEHVKVDWDLTGWRSGDSWGSGAGTVRFDIGHARISHADLQTHMMTVTEDGRTVATYPISGGKPTDPTMNGVHIVMDRQSVVRMNSATNGVPVDSPDGYDELVYMNVHISDTGEYVHAADWSVASQGRANVSHGCINLSPENAQQFFNFSRVGDVIVVTGSPRGPEFGDHGVMDWSTKWSEFTRVMPAVEYTNVK